MSYDPYSTFGQIPVGTTFSFRGHVGRENWTKIGPHQARLVNQAGTRNVGAGEQVSILAMPRQGGLEGPVVW